MKRRIQTLAVIFAGVLFLSGCHGDAGGEAYKIREEDKLILYTSHKKEVYGPLVKEFEERTGIWVEVHAGGSTELLEAVRTQAQEGKKLCDVMFGGGVESYEAYEEYFEPYACSQRDKLDPAYASPDNLWTIFSELPIVFVYNNKLLSEAEAPKSWAEFLTDRWKGRIAFADPKKSGTSYTALATMSQILEMEDKSLLEQFCQALDGKLSPGSGDVTKEVSAGIRLAGITLEETARKEMAKGADIGMVYPKEGTSAVPDGCALVQGAPHPDNARKFIDFTVSDDVQRLLTESLYRRTVRRDMQNETKDEEDMLLIPFDLAEAGSKQDEFLGMWEELFSGESSQ